MYIPIILGTAREGRRSENVAKFMLAEIMKTEAESEIIDVRDFRIAATNNTGEIPQAKALAEKIKKAEALYFAMAQDLFYESGTIKDESYRQRAEAFFQELFNYAKIFKAAR